MTFPHPLSRFLHLFSWKTRLIPSAGWNNLHWGTFLAALGETELEKRLLVRALISPFSADDDNNNHSQEWQQMGKREHRRLFKEAYTQLLSAIKTQISEDEPEPNTQAIDCGRTHPVVCHRWRILAWYLCTVISRPLDRLVSRDLRKDCLVIRLCGLKRGT